MTRSAEQVPTVRDAAAIGPRILKDPRSVEFAWQTVNWLKGRFHSLSVSEQHWQDALKEAEQYQIYKRVPPEKPYGSMNALLKAEIGVDQETSLSVVRGRVLSMAAASQTTGDVLPEGRPKKLDKLSSFNSQEDRAKENGIGIVSQKKLDKLARTRADLLDEVKAGHLSIHRASIMAGHVKELSALDLLKRVWTKASPEERQAFLAWIGEKL